MKRIAALATLGLLALVASAAQAAPQYAPAPPKHSHRCLPRSVGYYAVGTLVNSSLTAEEHGRYSGTLEVEVKRANHGGATGKQAFTLSGARVRFHHGVDSTAPAAGSRVKLHGKVTKLAKHCPSEGFTPTITIKKVDVSLARH